MTPLDPVTLSFGAALLLGLSFGAGPCNLACLPYLGPVLMTSSEGVRGSWRTLLPFSAGRLTGYSLLGAVAGGLGLLVQDWIAGPWVHWLMGGATMLVAIALLYRQRRSNTRCERLHISRDDIVGTDEFSSIRHPGGCRDAGNSTSYRISTSAGKTEEVIFNRELSRNRNSLPTALPGGLFLMGVGMALNPCAPLTVVILAAATTASAFAGLSLGVGFGLGAVILPTLFFALGVAHFGNQVRKHLWQWRRTLENASAGLLLLLGAGTALGWIAP